MKEVRQRKANIVYRLYVESKKQYKGTKQKKTYRHRKQTYVYKIGKGGDKQGIGNSQM